MKTDSVNLLIVGGSGFWSERNHHPSILLLKSKGVNVKVVAICDYYSPNLHSRPNTNKVVFLDSPIWINPYGKSNSKLKQELDALHKEKRIDAVIIASNPSTHFFYARWAAMNGISILCDKPIISVSHSAYDKKSAGKIWNRYLELMNLVSKNKQKNENYLACSPLRRRALTPFINVANWLNQVRNNSFQGPLFIDIIVNSGIHKLPGEFVKGGAHGALEGVGSLTHTSYHYIDILAWYLLVANSNVSKLEISPAYVFRVKDYLQIEGYRNLRKYADSGENEPTNVKIPDAVLNSELDFAFNIKLLDDHDRPIGRASYALNHTSFSPRLVGFDSNANEPAQKNLGGRMSHLYVGIQQSGIQSVEILKNDVVFFGNNILVKRRLHPKLGKMLENFSYPDAYDKSTLTPTDLIEEFLCHISGKSKSVNPSKFLSELKNQALTNKIFATFYEQIAEDFKSSHSNEKISKVIELDYFRNQTI